MINTSRSEMQTSCRDVANAPHREPDSIVSGVLNGRQVFPRSGRGSMRVENQRAGFTATDKFVDSACPLFPRVKARMELQNGIKHWHICCTIEGGWGIAISRPIVLTSPLDGQRRAQARLRRR
jgi:hypothetical protein